MSQLRIGILGASRIAELAIVKPAHDLGHRLVAVAARDRSRAEIFATEYGVERVLDTYEDVLSDPEVDVVYNPLANSFHGPWNLAAIGAGKPVLTEKPFARNSSEADEVRRAAVEHGVPIMEGFHYLFHPITQRVLKAIDTGTIGTVQRVEVTMRMTAPRSGDPRWSYELAGGGIMDLGCYGIHALRQIGQQFAGGEPSVLTATATERNPQVDEDFAIRFGFPSGATGSVDGSMVAEKFEMTLRVVGDRGEIFAPDYLLQYGDDRVLVTTPAERTVEHMGLRSTYTYQLEAFARHVREGTPFLTGADDAVANMALVDAAYTAAGLKLR